MAAGDDRMLVDPIVLTIPHDSLVDNVRRLALNESVNPYSVRYVAHSPPFAEEFSRTVVLPRVEQTVGTLLKPSYSFVSRYPAGGYLRRHTDRPMCVWTVSHTIEAVGRPAEDWPLWINGLSFPLRTGEAALFLGTSYPHWRNAMPAGMVSYTNVYFHFVPIDYDGPMR